MVWRWALACAAFRIVAAYKAPSGLWLLPSQASARSHYEAPVPDPGGELLDVDRPSLSPAPEVQAQRPLAHGDSLPMVRRLLRSSRDYRVRAARMPGARLTGRRAKNLT